MNYKYNLVIKINSLANFENIDQLNRAIELLKDDFRFAIIVREVDGKFGIKYDHDLMQFFSDKETFIKLLAKYLIGGNIFIDFIGEGDDRVSYLILKGRYTIYKWEAKVVKECKL